MKNKNNVTLSQADARKISEALRGISAQINILADIIKSLPSSEQEPKQEPQQEPKQEPKQAPKQEPLKNRFNIPFVGDGNEYKACYKNKKANAELSMNIKVVSKSSCRILAGSCVVYKQDEGKISAESVKVHKKLIMELTDGEKSKAEKDGYFKLSHDVVDVKVGTAATLLFGRAESTKVFKSVETNEQYKPTRVSTPKTTYELESYIFKNTK